MDVDSEMDELALPLAGMREPRLEPRLGSSHTLLEADEALYARLQGRRRLARQASQSLYLAGAVLALAVGLPWAIYTLASRHAELRTFLLPIAATFCVVRIEKGPLTLFLGGRARFAVADRVARDQLLAADPAALRGAHPLDGPRLLCDLTHRARPLAPSRTGQQSRRQMVRKHAIVIQDVGARRRVQCDPATRRTPSSTSSTFW